MDTFVVPGVVVSTRPAEISSIMRDDQASTLQVEFNGSKTFTVPYNFIRDSSVSCFDAKTGLRTSSISSVSGKLAIDDAGIVRGKGINKLRVEWTDGDVTELQSIWLYSKCVSDRDDSGFDEELHPQIRFWGSDLTDAIPTFDYKSLCSDSFLQFTMMQSLIYKEGIVLIRSAQSRGSLLKQICNRVLRGEGGLHLHLATGKGADGGFAAAVPLGAGRPIHSERTYCEGELGFVALMCTKQAENGGQVILVDGYNLESRIREEFPEHHHTLCTATVLYSSGEHSLGFRAERSVFALDRRGKVQTVAFDEQHRMRWEGGPRSGGKFLDAWCTVANMAYRPELVTSQLLQVGDILVIDARRVLWGQAPWKGGPGACAIEKEYVERNQVLSRYRSLRSTEQDLQGSQPHPRCAASTNRDANVSTQSSVSQAAAPDF